MTDEESTSPLHVVLAPLTRRQAYAMLISVFGEISKEWEMGVNDVFRALSDPTRREILRLLQAGDMTAGEISDRFPLARSTLSGHFNVLKQAGLIVMERQGTRIVYSLDTSAFDEAMATILDLFGVGKQERGGGNAHHVED
ncbi:MAG TPA: autorepressor SdpR family transcription factor [Chloroflexota bacterium]|nr:autorepressor SdpR family transcription factor [Chloroflexota bacterium]